jgi:hypothetical protein
MNDGSARQVAQVREEEDHVAVVGEGGHPVERFALVDVGREHGSRHVAARRAGRYVWLLRLCRDGRPDEREQCDACQKSHADDAPLRV